MFTAPPSPELLSRGAAWKLLVEGHVEPLAQLGLGSQAGGDHGDPLPTHRPATGHCCATHPGQAEELIATLWVDPHEQVAARARGDDDAVVDQEGEASEHPDLTHWATAEGGSEAGFQGGIGHVASALPGGMGRTSDPQRRLSRGNQRGPGHPRPE